MRAVVIDKYGPIEALHEATVPKPKVEEAHDLLVRVRSTSVNPVDSKKRVNFGQLDEALAMSPLVLGWDAAGTVECVGSAVKQFAVGDRVYFAGTIARQGCNSQYCLVDERIVAHMPKSLSFEDASSLPLTAITAWEAFADKLQLPAPKCVQDKVSSNKSLLIVNGAGGVGSIAIQLAKKVFGVKKVIATASRPETIEWCKKQGADEVINHRKDLAEELRRVGEADGQVDLIFCCFDLDPYFEKLVQLIHPYGQIVSIVGPHAPLNVGSLFFKCGSLHFEFMFTRPLVGFDVEAHHRVLKLVADFVDAGLLTHTKTQTLPFSAASLAEAHRLMDSSTVFGKVVLPFPEDW